MRRLSVALMVLAGVVIATPARANTYTLLTPADVTRISAWLPAGFTYTFTGIFDKEHGDGQTVGSFHAAVDGAGAGPGEVGTITLLRVQDIEGYRNCVASPPRPTPECGPGTAFPGASPGAPIIDYDHAIPVEAVVIDGGPASVFEKIGGYNPTPFNSSGVSSSGAGAFIFNLDHPGASYIDWEGNVRLTKEDQNSANIALNDPTLGPSFGFDIHNGGNLEISDAYLYHDWYGPGASGDGSKCIEGRCYPFYVRIEGLEVFTVTAIPIVREIPEPASLLLMGTGLIGMVAVYRKRNKTAVKAAL